MFIVNLASGVFVWCVNACVYEHTKSASVGYYGKIIYIVNLFSFEFVFV